MKFKFILLALFLGTTFLSGAQESAHELNWLTDFQQAKTIAAKEHKPIAMLFTGSDWCPPCRMMHRELFSDEKFIEEAKKTVLVLVDFPRRKKISATQRKLNYQLRDLYNPGGSVPVMIAVSPEGKRILGIRGYLKGNQQRNIDFLKSVLKNKY